MLKQPFSIGKSGNVFKRISLQLLWIMGPTGIKRHLKTFEDLFAIASGGRTIESVVAVEDWDADNSRGRWINIFGIRRTAFHTLQIT